MEKLIKNKEKILPHLYDWFETFNPIELIYNEDKKEEVFRSYKYLRDLYDRFENDQCDKEGYEVILFHIEEQINYDGEIIIEI